MQRAGVQAHGELLVRARPFHVDGGEWGKSEDKRIRAILGGVMSGFLAALVADVRATVGFGIGIEEFAVEAGIGDAEAVAFANDRGGVEDDHDEVVRVFAAADESKDAVVRVVGVDPFETVPIEIDLMQSGFGRVEMVQVTEEKLNAAMRGELKDVPFEAMGFGPFRALGELLAHEEKLFAGVRVLIGVEKPEIGELLPGIAGHFVEKGILAVHYFVVREGQQEVFGEGVEQRERELVVFEFAMNGVVGKIV